jgi:hypothetical protein
MTAYTGDERRVLDPKATAVVDAVGDLGWRVRAGDTSYVLDRRDEAEDAAYTHNYFHGHMLLDSLPRPLDRRAPHHVEDDPDTALTLALAATGEAGYIDALIAASFESTVLEAVQLLDRAARIEGARHGHMRAAGLHGLARQAEEVLRS